MTLFKDSSEKVEAIYKREAIGLEAPILDNWAKTVLPSSVGSMVESLSTINSKASMTPGPYCCLLSKSALSLSLAALSSTSLEFNKEI